MSTSNEIARLYTSLGFRVDDKKLKQYEKTINQTADNFKKFEKTVQKSTEPLKKQALALSALEKRYNKHSGTLSQIYRDYKKVNSEYKQGNISIEKRKRLLNEIAQKYRNVKNQADKANAAETHVGNARTGVPHKGGIGSSAGMALGGMAAAVIGVTFALDGLRTSIMASNEIYQRQQRAVVSLMGTEGDKPAAKKKYKALDRFSDKYGIRTDSTIEAYNQLTGQTDPAGIDRKASDRSFEAVVAYAKSRGLNNEAISGVITALGQVAAKNQLYQEEIMQFNERGIALSQLISNATGIDPQVLRKQIENGKWDAERLFSVLPDALMSQAMKGGALAEALTSTESEANRRYNQATRSNVIANTAGLNDAVATVTRSITESLKTMEPFFVELGELAKATAPKIAENIKDIGELFAAIGNLMDALQGTDLSKGQILSFSSALNGLTRFIEDLTDTINLWKSDASLSTKLTTSAETIADMFVDLYKRFFDHIASVVNTVLPKSLEIETFYQKRLKSNPVVDTSGINALMGTNLQQSLNNYRASFDPKKIESAINSPTFNGSYGMGGNGMMLNGKSNYNTTNNVSINVQGYNQDPEELARIIDSKVTSSLDNTFRTASIANPRTER